MARKNSTHVNFQIPQGPAWEAFQQALWQNWQQHLADNPRAVLVDAATFRKLSNFPLHRRRRATRPVQFQLPAPDGWMPVTELVSKTYDRFVVEATIDATGSLIYGPPHCRVNFAGEAAELTIEVPCYELIP